MRKRANLTVAQAAWVEAQFSPGMTWLNRGRVWHVDHIIPLSLATNATELACLWQKENLRPIPSKDNLVKRGKLLQELFWHYEWFCRKYDLGEMIARIRSSPCGLT